MNGAWRQLQYSARNASSTVVPGILSHPSVESDQDMAKNDDTEAGVSLHKWADRSKVNDSRPRSSAKVHKNVPHTRIKAYFCQKIIPEQRGFVKGRPGETSPCSFPSQVAPPVHCRGLADVVYFDMSKAFDKVNH